MRAIWKGSISFIYTHAERALLKQGSLGIYI